MGIVQLVGSCTHCDVACAHGNNLHPVILPDLTNLLTTCTVVSSHFLFYHLLIVCNLNIWWKKRLSLQGKTCNLCAIDRVDFNHRIQWSAFYSTPAFTANYSPSRLNSGLLSSATTFNQITAVGVVPLRSPRSQRLAWRHYVQPDQSGQRSTTTFNQIQQSA